MSMFRFKKLKSVDQECAIEKQKLDMILSAPYKTSRVNEVVEIFKTCVDQYYSIPPLRYGLGPEKDIEKAIEKLRQEKSAGSWCMLGICYQYFLMNLVRDYTKAFAFYYTSADLGHPLALCQKGYLLYHGKGVAKDQTAAFTCFLKSSMAGCQLAYFYLAMVYETGNGTKQSFSHAAWCLLHVEQPSYDLDRLLRLHAFECCPFGYWTPWPELQRLVHPTVTTCLQTTMLMCNRLGIDRHVARIIAAYVCTRGDEWIQEK